MISDSSEARRDAVLGLISCLPSQLIRTKKREDKYMLDFKSYPIGIGQLSNCT